MGMFDSFRDANDNEWQTKAYGNALDAYRVGDRIPIPSGGDGGTYQVEVLRVADDIGHDAATLTDEYATITDDVLTAVGVPRDRSLESYDYHGTPVPY